MSIIDKKYLSLQFWKKVHEKNGFEFQTLFSDIMQKKHNGFIKVRPYGRLGDGGNDGYIPDQGIYYQVYSPQNPTDKSATAAQKMIDDFNNLMASPWVDISQLKEYQFVFNDKNNGSDIQLEAAKAKLANDNPGIVFGLLLPVKLLEIFLTLNHEQQADIGFDVDSRNALSISREFLKGLQTELDRGHSPFVSQALESIKDVIASQGDEGLILDLEIMQARTFQHLELVNEAKIKYENLYIRHPEDPRAPLYLAEIHLNDNDLDENERLLKEVETKNSSHWLYRLERIVRNSVIKKQISMEEIDTSDFPTDDRIRADFYRVYSNFLMQSGDLQGASIFIKRATSFNPERLHNYIVEISIEIRKLYQSGISEIDYLSKSESLLREIDLIIERFSGSGNIGNRNKAILNYYKCIIFANSMRYNELETITQETIPLLLLCYFDRTIDSFLTSLTEIGGLTEIEFANLLNYLRAAKKPMSTSLSKRLFLEFAHCETLADEGSKFFEDQGLSDFTLLIDDLENKDYKAFASKIKDDHQFAVNIFIAFNNPDLRKEIIDSLPEENIEKDKMSFYLEDDLGNFDAAFDHLKSIDLDKSSFFELVKFITLAKRKEAWDLVISISKRLLSKRQNSTRQILHVKLDLFTANLKLEGYPEVIALGREILESYEFKELLDKENLNIILRQTIVAHLKRSNDTDNNLAKELVEHYGDLLQDYKSNMLAAEVYVRLEDGKSAIIHVVKGLKNLGRPSPEDYSDLFFLLNASISNLLELKTESIEKIEKESFVKFEDSENWYYIGEDNGLDAQKVSNETQGLYLGKAVGDIISYPNKYISKQHEKKVEAIFRVEQYVVWSSTFHFKKLSLEGIGKGISIDVPELAEGGLDFKNMLAVMEDQQQRGSELFKMYCEQNVPLALLAANEGSLMGAIGRIIGEQKGYVRMSDGTKEEFEEQLEIARRVVQNSESFYIDGSSAAILAETGLLLKLHPSLPNLKVPRSVIALLYEMKERLNKLSGMVGQMFYSQGKVGLKEHDEVRSEAIKKRISETIDLLESNHEKIEIISSANKEDVFSEQKVPPSLCDATVLAQRDQTAILTEDYLYLFVNQVETGKSKPPYFSSMALMRVLYDRTIVTYAEYLDFFSFLASYRFRFLQITTDDLQKTVFGDGLITVIEPEKLNRLHLYLTLSKEYGVAYRDSARVLSLFILRLLIDDTVSMLIAESIFSEIVALCPNEFDKNQLKKDILAMAVQEIFNRRVPIGRLTKEKVYLLTQRKIGSHHFF